MGASLDRWLEFLEDYPVRRRDFEERHPELRTLRLLALFGPPVVIALVTVSVLVTGVPRPGGERQGFPTTFVVILFLLTILLVGLIAYGIVRWLEDRVAGQIALAVGWGGLAGTYVVFAQCAREWSAAWCFALPAAIVLGLGWLTAWLVIGLVVDYRPWSRPDLPPESPIR